MKLGEEQWQLQECYNCHKLKGEGGKKRGPELDNIGILSHRRRDQAENSRSQELYGRGIRERVGEGQDAGQV